MAKSKKPLPVNGSLADMLAKTEKLKEFGAKAAALGGGFGSFDLNGFIQFLEQVGPQAIALVQEILAYWNSLNPAPTPTPTPAPTEEGDKKDGK